MFVVTFLSLSHASYNFLILICSLAFALFYEFRSYSHITLVHKSSLIKSSVFIYLVKHSYYILSECTVRF